MPDVVKVGLTNCEATPFLQRPPVLLTDSRGLCWFKCSARRDCETPRSVCGKGVLLQPPPKSGLPRSWAAIPICFGVRRTGTRQHTCPRWVQQRSGGDDWDDEKENLSSCRPAVDQSLPMVRKWAFPWPFSL